MKKVNDSLVSLASSLGGYRDAPFSGLIGAFTDIDWLRKAAVYRIPEDCFKKGYSWVADERQIVALEREERRHKIHAKKKQALALSRLYGEAYLYFDDGRNATEELRLDTIRRGGLRFVNVLRRDQVTLGELEKDPLSQYFGQPVSYTVSSANGFNVEIHPSRIARFAHFPDPLTGQGRSVLSVVNDVIDAAIDTRKNVVCLVEQARTWVMSAKGLFDDVTDPETEANLRRRYEVFQSMLRTNSLAVIDLENEKFDQQSTSFSTLPEVIETMRREVSAALEIPYALLFGRQGGLGTNGETDLSEYYDNVKVVQTNDIDGPCEILDQAIIRSALGNDGAGEVFKEWRSLWEMTDKEKAEIATAYATAAKTAIDAGIVEPSAMTVPLSSQWVEIGVFPGIEQEMQAAEARSAAEEEETAGADDALGRQSD